MLFHLFGICTAEYHSFVLVVVVADLEITSFRQSNGGPRPPAHKQSATLLSLPVDHHKVATYTAAFLLPLRASPLECERFDNLCSRTEMISNNMMEPVLCRSQYRQKTLYRWWIVFVYYSHELLY